MRYVVQSIIEEPQQLPTIFRGSVLYLDYIQKRTQNLVLIIEAPVLNPASDLPEPTMHSSRALLSHDKQAWQDAFVGLGFGVQGLGFWVSKSYETTENPGFVFTDQKS